MSAREDYPRTPPHGYDRQQYEEMCAEIDGLRQEIGDLRDERERNLHRIADYWERYESPHAWHRAS